MKRRHRLEAHRKSMVQHRKRRFASLLRCIEPLRLHWLLVAVGAQGATALAAPVGPTVTAGDVRISSSGPRTLVEQQTPRGIVEWESFSLGRQERIDFRLPSRNSAILNRVTGAMPSRIDGVIASNGSVYLINPRGIVVGPNGRIDVGGNFVGSTLGISNDDFLHASDAALFTGGSQNAIVNLGTIRSRHGDVVLLARQVENRGTIDAARGDAVLAAGSEMLLHSSGPDGVTVRVGSGQVVNAGTIQAVQAELKAVGGNVYALAIKNTGVIRATGVDRSGGRVRLVADRGVIEQAGLIDASGKSPDARGGDVLINADHILLAEESTIDVRGSAGGGDVRVGTDVKPWASIPTEGRHTVPSSVPNAQNATAVVIDPTSRIEASATRIGRGGNVAVWSDNYTSFFGTILANGGRRGGDGGWVETSSKDNLQAFGVVGARVPGRRGRQGEWLLDPRNVTITSSTSGGSFSGANPDIFTPTSNDALVNAATISSTLSAGTSVTITTGSTGTQDGNINVNANITKSGGATATLTLRAANDIIVNNAITSSSGALNVILNSDNDNGTASGVGAVSIAANITTLGGSITIGGGADPTSTAAFGNSSRAHGVEISGAVISTSGGIVNIRGTSQNGSWGLGVNINSGAQINSAAGAITIVGVSRGTLTGSDGVNVNGSTTQVTSTTGNISITGTGGPTGQYNRGVIVDGGLIASTGSGTISVTGTLTAGTSTDSPGLQIVNGGYIRNTSGSMTLTGTGSNNSNNFGIQIYNGGGIEGTGAGNINITANGGTNDDFLVNTGTNYVGEGPTAGTYSGSLTINADDLSIANVTLQSTGNLVIQPRSAGTSLNLGTGATNSGLQLDNNELDRIADGFNSITFGSATGIGDITLTAYTYKDNVTFRSPTGDGDISITGNVATGSSTQVGTISLQAGDDITLNAGISLTSQNRAITLDADIDGGGGGINTFNTTSTINANGGAITLTGDEQDNLGTITSAGGTLLIQPRTVSRPIAVGIASGGTVALDVSELNRITDGFASITIGSATGSGAVDIRSYTFRDNVTIQSPTGAGSITLNGDLATGSTTQAGTITLQAGDSITVSNSIDTSPSIISQGQAITLNSNRDASGSGLIAITGATITSNGGDITLGGGTTPATTAASGSAGGGSAGIGVFIGASTVSADAGAITITGSGGPSAGGSMGVDIRSSSTISTTTGAINITGLATSTASNSPGFSTGSGTVSSAGGAITISATGAGSNYGWFGWGNAQILNSGAGTISITASTGAAGTAIFTSNSNNRIGNSTPANLTGGITLNADSIALGGISIGGSGALNIQPTTASTPIGLGASASGTLNLDATELATIQNGFSSITIGHATGSGAIDVRSWTANDPLIIRSPAGAGSITINGDLATGSTTQIGTITLQAGDSITVSNSIDTSPSITTQGQAITLNSDRDASGAGGISITSGTVASNGGAITLGGGANPQSTPAYGTSHGVTLSASSINSGGGSIDITGVGGSGGFAYGIYTVSGSISSGAGAMNLTGTGGTASSISIGVQLEGTQTLSSTDGAINIVGVSGTGPDARGINVGGSGPYSTTTGAINLTGTGGTVDLRVGNFSSTSGNLNLFGDTVTLTSSFTSAGAILISPRTDSTSIGIGASASGMLNLDATELGYLQNGFSSITIGSATGTGAIDVRSYTFSDNLTLRSPAGTAIIAINGDLATGSTTQAGTITLQAGAGISVSNSIDTTPSITTQGQAITLNSDRDASGAGVISMTNATLTSNGGAITLGGGADPLTTPAIATSGGGNGGIVINGGTISSDAGAISIRGNNVASGVSSKRGISIFNAGRIQSTTGSISLIGSSTSGGTGSSIGVAIGGGNSDTRITSGSGAIEITGTGDAGTGTANDGIMLASAASINSTSGNITFTGTAGTGSSAYAQNGTLNAGSGTATLIADSIDLNGTISGTGSLFLTPATPATSIGVGTGASGDLNFTNTELDFIQNGFGSITIGHATGSGAIDVRAYTYLDPIVIRSPVGAGSITLNGALATGSGTSIGSIMLTAAGAITGAAGSSITTQGQTITLTGSPVSGAMAINSNGGLVTINQTGTGTVSGVISGSGALTKLGTGTLTLSGANTYTGVTTVSAGTLQAGSNGAFGNLSNITLDSGTTLDLAGFSPTIGSLAGAGAVANSSGTVSTLTTGGSNASTTHSGAFSSAFSGIALVKTGTGTFRLQGSKSTTSTTVSAGILEVATALSLSTLNIASGASLHLIGTPSHNKISFTPGVVWTIAGTLDNQQVGSVVSQTFPGTVNLNGGTIIATGNGDADNWGQYALSQSPTINATGNSTISALLRGTTPITFNTPGALDSLAVSGSIQNGSGTVAVNKSGGGTVTLSGANTYTGATTVSAGTLVAEISTTKSGISTSAVSIAGAATLQLNNLNTSGSNVTVSNTFTGAGGLGLTFAAGGSARNTIFSGLAGFTGNVALFTATTTGDKFNGQSNIGGSLTIGDNTTAFFSNSRTVTGGVSVTGTGNTESLGALRIDAGTFTGNISLTGNASLGGHASGTAVINGDISGGFNLTKVATATWVLIGTNTYTGTTTISAGTIQIGNGGTTGTLGGGNVINNASLIFNRSNAITVANVISGSGTLTQSGTGTTTLSGANTYTGSTDVNAGTLTISGSWNRNGATANASVASGAMLNGSGIITASTLSASGAGTVNLTGNNAINTLSGSMGTLSLYNNAPLNIAGLNTTGSVSLQTTPTHDITITQPIVTAASGNSVVIASGRHFINNAGASGIDPGPGRFLVYSQNPTDTIEGISASKRYNRTFTANPPASINDSGNIFLYSISPTLTITADDKNNTYGQATPTLTYSIDGLIDGDTFNDATDGAPSLSIVGGGVDAGSYTIDADTGTLTSVMGYTLAFVDGTLTVDRASLTITADAKTKVYGQSDPALTYTYAGLTNGDTASIFTGSLTREVGEDVDTYGILQGSLNAGNNYDITYVGADFDITRALLTITADAKTKVYGQSDPALTYTYAGLTNGDTASIFTGNLTREPGEDVDTYAILQGSLSAGNNYNITYVGADFDITRALLTITADAKTKVYGQSDPALTYTYAGLTNGDTASIFTGSLTREVGEDVDTYAILQGSLSAGNNYDITYVGADFDITRALLTITADAKTKVYGQSDPALTYTYAGLTNGDTASIFTGNLTREPGEDVDTYAILQGSLSAGNNYNITYVGADFDITRALLTITADDFVRRYGQANPTLTYRIDGLQFDDDLNDLTLPTVETTADRRSGVGQYAIVASGGSADNYTFVYRDGTLRIDPAQLTITAEDASRLYGAANPSFTLRFEGLVHDDDASDLAGLKVDTGATPRSGVGSYPITPSGASNPNYDITFVNGQLRVTPAALTIRADDLTRNFGEANPSLTAQFVGLLPWDSPSDIGVSLDTDADLDAEPGLYPIRVLAGLNPNYAILATNGTLTVRPRRQDPDITPPPFDADLIFDNNENIQPRDNDIASDTPVEIQGLATISIQLHSPDAPPPSIELRTVGRPVAHDWWRLARLVMGRFKSIFVDPELLRRNSPSDTIQLADSPEDRDPLAQQDPNPTTEPSQPADEAADEAADRPSALTTTDTGPTP